MKSQMTFSVPTAHQGRFLCASAKYLPKNVSGKRELSHSGTEETLAEGQVLMCTLRHVTHLILCPGDVQQTHKGLTGHI